MQVYAIRDGRIEDDCWDMTNYEDLGGAGADLPGDLRSG